MRLMIRQSQCLLTIRPTYDSISNLYTTFHHIQLVTLHINQETNSVNEGTAMIGKDVIETHTGKYGSLCFVVRRPGK